MRFRPTHALVRSLALAGGLVLLASVLGRVDVLVLAAPFVVHAGWSLLSRPDAMPEPTVTPRTVLIPEGDALDVTVGLEGAPTGSVAAVQWPRVQSAAFDPDSGTVLGVAAPGVTATAEPDRWGRYVFGPALVACTDASGGWRATADAPPVTVTVRPASQLLEGGSGVANPIGIVGSHRSRHRGDGSDLADVRGFQPGDRLRRINWRVTSRLGAVHVNSMLTERDTDVLIVADTLHSISPADPMAATSLDLGVRAIAAISRHYVGFGDRVAVHDLGRRIGRVRPGTGPRQTRLVLDVLSRADRSRQDWSGVRPVPTLSSGTMVFFCSPLVEREVVDELIRLRRLGGEVVAVDTLPEGVGGFADIPTFRKESFLGEAWMVRRLERDEVLDRLQSLGIPVTPWRGSGSLASVLLAMEAARSAPRRAGV